MTTQAFPISRGQRLRRSARLRGMLRENSVTLDDLIYPIFVEEHIDASIPVASMPGVSRIAEKRLAAEAAAIAADGVRAVMIFGVSHAKDSIGTDSLSPNGLIARAVRTVKAAAPELLVITDTCFCEFTDHGHCGVLKPSGEMDNDVTIENLGRQAVVAIEAGADMVAPSSMMDGQVLAIRRALDAAGHGMAPIMSYSSKFASSFYGPFREAAGCDLKGDRKTYQMDPGNAREALLESVIDEAEGADILMVKPGMPYIDILARLRQQTLKPLAVYQVSGEYAMIKFAAQAGAINERAVVRESLMSFKRAGADLILTYFARDVAREGVEL